MAPVVVDGQAERQTDPIGLGTAEPRLSWRLESAESVQTQTGYVIQTAPTEDFDHPETDTGLVHDGSPLDRPWPGPPLESRQAKWWRVRVEIDAGPSEWSRPWRVEAGLLHSDDWDATFIGPGWAEDTESSQPCPLLRRAFRIDQAIDRARLYVTALGCYEIEINGTRVGDEHLAPGWTPYQHRLLYRTHDVTGLLRQGENVIGAVLADGWYRGYLGWTGRRNHYGQGLGLMAQLEVGHPSGEATVVTTNSSDGSWRSSTGAIRAADIYRGQQIDVAADQPGWSAPGFDDSGWPTASDVAYDRSNVEAATAPPIRAIGTVTPVALHRRADSSVIIDFGQNLVGHLRLNVPAGPARTVTVRHAEILQPDGSLCTDLLRDAYATDTLTTDGLTDQVFEPRFTFHGFRFSEVTGLPDLEGSGVEAVVVASDLPDRGQFSCSEADLNQLYSNIRWSLRGNTLSVPTDCPQRDERLGWTGDAQVFAPTANFMVDASAFFTSWLADVVSEQGDDGAVPWVVPNVLGATSAAAAGWADVITFMPHDLYVAYGDPIPLAITFDAMRRWTDYQLNRAGDDLIWSGDFQFGDWLDPDAPAGRPNDAKADRDLVATAFMAHSLALTGWAAAILGRHTEQAGYAELAERVRRAWWDRFGEDALTTQTGAALAIQFDLAPESERDRAGDCLSQLVDKAGGHLATGFLGTPLLCHALAATGHIDDAYRVLLARTLPSWLYPLSHGATTVWERWDALRPDGSIPSDPLSATNHSMVSFNHYAYGAVADFLHRRVAGLAPDPANPGYRRILVEPKPGGSIQWARASHRSRYGTVEVAWSAEGATFELEVKVPPLSVARIQLPDGSPAVEVPAGDHRFECRHGS